jgi:DNA-binding NtrC family response regulator
MAIEKVIVLEDEMVVRKNLIQLLHRKRLDVAEAPTLEKAISYLEKDDFDLVFADVRLPDGDGRELLTRCQAMAKPPLVVMMTSYGSVESAVECMRNGAFDYITKPFSTDQIEVTLKKADDFTRLVRVNQHLNDGERSDVGYEILGDSEPMAKLADMIRKVSRTEATVMIQGESGTGKELVARAIHRQSPRSQEPFISVNCAAVPENLVESEFFGHEKGAFTGATTRREGRFELAHGGTILLDEISEISPVVQSKLLRVLQERELERVGGNRTIRVNVRVVATTNRDLAQSVEKGEFRQDLYFRLNVVPVFVPSLRDRRGDIELLAEYFMKRYSRKHGCKVAGLSDEALRDLVNHRWPGNVRELQNVIERAVILSSEGEMVGTESLGLIAPSQGTSSVQFAAPSVPSADELSSDEDSDDERLMPLDELEKRHILKTLDSVGGNRTKAAGILSISIRTLRNKLKEYRESAGAGSEDSDKEAGEE